MSVRRIDEGRAFGNPCDVRIEKHFEIVRSGEPVAKVLSEATRLSKASVKQAMTKGAVWLSRGAHTDRIRRADRNLSAGDTLHLYFDEDILGQQPADAVLIADEGRYSIWHKPYGMLSQGSKWGDHCTINRWVEGHLEPQRPAFITHRLDRAATGLMVIAHGRKAAAHFAEQFRLQKVGKKYQAIVHGRFPESRILDAAIGKKPALSHGSLLSYDAPKDLSLVAVKIATGRKHQIRHHLAGAGFPIVGDRLYGNMQRPDERNLCLSSCELSFTPPGENQRRTYTLPRRLLPVFP